MWAEICQRGDLRVNDGVIKTYNLQLILPEFLFASLVKKGKVADMVDKDVSQKGQLGFLRGDLAMFGSKRGAKALEGCR